MTAVQTPGQTLSIETALARLRRLVRTDAAAAEHEAADLLSAVPDQPEALRLLARALSARRATDDAIEALRRSTAADPDNPDGWRALGDQLILKGDGPGADAAYARQIKASVNDPMLREAAVALVDNDLAVVERILKPHLKRHPTDVAAIRMLAELAGRLGRYGDAEKLLSRAIELAPGFAQARFNLATVLYRQNRSIEAIVQLDHLLDEDPDNPGCRNLKAAALGRIGNYDEAIAHFEQVLQRQQGNPKLWMSYGHTLKTVGRQDQSVAAYRRALAIAPTLGEVWWSLANLKTWRFSDQDVALMENGLKAPGLSDEDRFHLHFALGKALEDRRNWRASFIHYDAGNVGRRKSLPYDPEATRAHVDRYIAVLTPATLARLGPGGSDARDPIFILGMPRAGSTLIEQILASHSMVEGTQELHEIGQIARSMAPYEDDDSEDAAFEPEAPLKPVDRHVRYPESLARLSAAERRRLGDGFIESTRIHRKTGRPLFIDKMPNNWRHIGLIHLILPNATIIDARRHPMDCCFSNYKQHFARGQAFAYGLRDMGRNYADYVRLMAHVDRVLPGRVHRVIHERLVDDPEAEVRALLDHIGLPFEDGCLRFHENARAVQTASSEQVRRPINRDGIDRWRHYEPWLAPLKEALGPVLTAYPDTP